jgi:hypothetical protein
VNRVPAIVSVALGVLVCGAAAGCGGSSSAGGVAPAAGGAPAPTPSASATATAAPTTALAINGCGPSLLPSHFTADAAHSGKLGATTYSAAADVQAALEYDQLQAGGREVYLRHAAGAKSPVTQVISCVGLQFPSAHLAGRFFLSYQALRKQAKGIAHEITPEHTVVGVTGVKSYFEKDQSFRGYHISSTNVIEVSGLVGNTLYITSDAATTPSVSLARTLLESMVSHS